MRIGHALGRGALGALLGVLVTACGDAGDDAAAPAVGEAFPVETSPVESSTGETPPDAAPATPPPAELAAALYDEFAEVAGLASREQVPAHRASLYMEALALAERFVTDHPDTVLAKGAETFGTLGEVDLADLRAELDLARTRSARDFLSSGDVERARETATLLADDDLRAALERRIERHEMSRAREAKLDGAGADLVAGDWAAASRVLLEVIDEELPYLSGEADLFAALTAASMAHRTAGDRAAARERSLAAGALLATMPRARPEDLAACATEMALLGGLEAGTDLLKKRTLGRPELPAQLGEVARAVHREGDEATARAILAVARGFAQLVRHPGQRIPAIDQLAVIHAELGDMEGLEACVTLAARGEAPGRLLTGSRVARVRVALDGGQLTEALSLAFGGDQQLAWQGAQAAVVEALVDVGQRELASLVLEAMQDCPARDEAFVAVATAAVSAGERVTLDAQTLDACERVVAAVDRPELVTPRTFDAFALLLRGGRLDTARGFLVDDSAFTESPGPDGTWPAASILGRLALEAHVLEAHVLEGISNDAPIDIGPGLSPAAAAATLLAEAVVAAGRARPAECRAVTQLQLVSVAQQLSDTTTAGRLMDGGRAALRSSTDGRGAARALARVAWSDLPPDEAARLLAVLMQVLADPGSFAPSGEGSDGPGPAIVMLDVHGPWVDLWDGLVRGEVVDPTLAAVDAARDETAAWWVGVRGGLASALVRAGRLSEALAVARELPDGTPLVIALARVAAAAARAGDSDASAGEITGEMTSEITSTTTSATDLAPDSTPFDPSQLDVERQAFAALAEMRAVSDPAAALAAFSENHLTSSLVLTMEAPGSPLARVRETLFLEHLAESEARAVELTAKRRIGEAFDVLAAIGETPYGGVTLGDAASAQLRELEARLYRSWLDEGVPAVDPHLRAPAPRRANSRWTGRDTDRVRDGVDAALNWLARHQHADGHWSARDFPDRCREGEACTGRGSQRVEVGVTGLALLAFLRAGETPVSGDHRLVVQHALHYLLEAQSEEGVWGVAVSAEHSYDHCIATLALLEMRHLTGWRGGDEAITRGLEYLGSLRNPGAGWRYYDRTSEQMRTYPNDASVTGWALHVLLDAREQGLEVDETAIADGLSLMAALTDEGGRTGYAMAGQGSSRLEGQDKIFDVLQTEAMTAVAVNVRLRADPELKTDDLIVAGAGLVAALPIVWDDSHPARRDFYGWYHATAALRRFGGDTWDAWRHSIFALLTGQQHGGEPFGSWDPEVSPWGPVGGRVYSTAILALTLQECIADE